MRPIYVRTPRAVALGFLLAFFGFVRVPAQAQRVQPQNPTAVPKAQPTSPVFRLTSVPIPTPNGDGIKKATLQILAPTSVPTPTPVSNILGKEASERVESALGTAHNTLTNTLVTMVIAGQGAVEGIKNTSDQVRTYGEQLSQSVGPALDQVEESLSSVLGTTTAPNMVTVALVTNEMANTTDNSAIATPEDINDSWAMWDGVLGPYTNIILVSGAALGLLIFGSIAYSLTNLLKAQRISNDQSMAIALQSARGDLQNKRMDEIFPAISQLVADSLKEVVSLQDNAGIVSRSIEPVPQFTVVGVDGHEYVFTTDPAWIRRKYGGKAVKKVTSLRNASVVVRAQAQALWERVVSERSSAVASATNDWFMVKCAPRT